MAEPDNDPEKISEMADSLVDLPSNALLQKWKSGDEAAAQILVDRYAMRLVALVASRLNQRFRASVDPEDVVQSAMGSFFQAVQHSRIQFSGSVSLWRLLATFTRRKMARSIETNIALKRGGQSQKISLETAESQLIKTVTINPDCPDEEWLEHIQNELPQDLHEIFQQLLGGKTQRAIAKEMSLDERTIRRRVARIRETLQPAASIGPGRNASHSTDEQSSLTPQNSDAFKTFNLSRIDYREFVLGKLIGSGGFGKVYRAAMQPNGRLVAVKFLRKTFWKNDEAKQTFLREIDAASQIKHPGVICYRGWGQSPHGGPYVVSEWIDGVPLLKCSNASPERFIALLRQVCDVTQAIHHNGLVHGDITPNNILVDRAGEVTLTDFGFSRRMPALVARQRLQVPAQESPDSSDLLLGGTLGFAAPEQISPAFGQISERTDIYAIGGLAYWFIFGRPPHFKSSVEESLSDTLSESNVTVEPHSQLTPMLANIISVTLRKSPSERIQRVSDLRRLIG